MIGARVRRAFGILRLVVAAVGIVALVFDFDYVLGFSTFSTINYFSYFTFQSNLLNVITLGASGALLLRGHTVGRALVSARAMVTTYVIVSGVVFGLIVSQAGSHHYRIDVPWSSQVLHFWLPSYVLIDWIIGVGRRRLRWRTVWIVLIFPVVWGIFTLIRGQAVRWYPYFFLDPDQVSGPGEFALYCGIAIGLFAGIMAGLVALSRLRPLLPRGAAADPGLREDGRLREDGGLRESASGSAAGSGSAKRWWSRATRRRTARANAAPPR
ncbi:Pr6Pr family membrane protein [Herbiconiux daphne]|uniref:Pr6Pr family membrane protein n=1 Tax=Herbiconiux daphne TaxID=2970914 RepID=A0ABT2H0T6_9MICO|nr:Pr6Pr family membrane protein [Herbiconiux daphne]MCS5733545.1 Pr6Pr family membrane protein [Herbiconiux daphne]